MDDRTIEGRLTEALTHLGTALLRDRELKDDLDRVTRLACRLLPQSSGASVSMLATGRPTTMATTDEVAVELDLIQYDASDGPCIAALGGQSVRIGFVQRDERFPHFAAGAADTRVRSVLSTPAIDHGMIVGSINIYSNAIDAFDDASRDVGTVLAAEVANAIAKSATLRRARDARQQLQQHYDEQTLVARAQGVLMSIEHCSAAQARNLISNAASEHGERLAQTAERILANVLSDQPPADSTRSVFEPGALDPDDG
jgi:GAF domain-containing protein